MFSCTILVITALLIAITVGIKSEPSTNGIETNVEANDTTNARLLSRKKRYLTFPEGSSFQLVFCVQTSALIPIGDIFLYGSTAALAWALPTDPDFFHMIKDKKSSRRSDTKELVYVDEKGKVLAKVPYRKSKIIINPAFSKRSVDNPNVSFKEKLKIIIDRNEMHKKQHDRKFLQKSYMNPKRVEFHRQSRVGLYQKIEKLLTGIGRDGRQCVLRKLCESARHTPPQGTFLQELLRVVFTLPKGTEFDEELHREYDRAHGSDDCEILYPGCEDIEIAAQRE